MIYQKKPVNFNPKFEVVGNFVQFGDEIVLLHRQTHKPQGDTWGIPSGKVDKGENIITTVGRETFEETGLVIPEEEIKFFMTTYVRYNDYDFIYHMFSVNLSDKLDVLISEVEHKEARWVKPSNAFKLPLIEDLDICLKLFFNI